MRHSTPGICKNARKKGENFKDIKRKNLLKLFFDLQKFASRKPMTRKKEHNFTQKIGLKTDSSQQKIHRYLQGFDLVHRLLDQDIHRQALILRVKDQALQNLEVHVKESRTTLALKNRHLVLQ